MDLGGYSALIQGASGDRSFQLKSAHAPIAVFKVSDCTKTLCVWRELEGAGLGLLAGRGKKIWVRPGVDKADTYESLWKHKLHPIPLHTDVLLPEAEASPDNSVHTGESESEVDREALRCRKRKGWRGRDNHCGLLM